MKKRLLSTLLALCMALALLPGAAMAAGMDFVIEGGILYEYNGPGGNVVIPDGVTYIDGFAFRDCTTLTGVTIPSSVTTIDYKAFSGCMNLTSVTIPDSVTTIGDYAFSNCKSLTSVTIPNSVTTIASFTFALCSNLTSVTIPNSVTIIEEAAFESCENLTSVIIPDSVTTIGKMAFANCDCLTAVTIPSSVAAIGGMAFTGTRWQENLGEFAVVNGILLEYQGKGGDVIIPDGVTTIEENAFYWCRDLTSVTIPADITSIKASAFSGCNNLTDIYYSGSESQWKQVIIEYGNDLLTNTTIHYNSTGPAPAPEQPAPAITPAPTPTTPAQSENAVLSPQNLTVNGADVTCEKYNIGGSNFFQLRELGGGPRL